MFRHNSHPHLVSMYDIYGNSLDNTDRQQGSHECHSSVLIEARTEKNTKSIILITAKDLSKFYNSLFTNSVV